MGIILPEAPGEHGAWFSPLFEIRQHRIKLRNHPAGHEAAFVLGDDDLVGARVAHGLGVAGLAGAGDDSGLGVQGLGSNGNVEVVAVVVDDDANASRALYASGLKDVVAFCVALYGENFILEQLAAEALAGFDEHERNLQAGGLIHHSSAYLSATAEAKAMAKFVHA